MVRFISPVYYGDWVFLFWILDTRYWIPDTG